MARISKEEHSRILRMVDSEHRKVAEVAAEYGCTPANIYALLSKLRRRNVPDTEAVGIPEEAAHGPISSNAALPPLSTAGQPTVTPAVPDLFELDPKLEAAVVHEAKAGRQRNQPVVALTRMANVKTPELAPLPALAAVQQQEPDIVSARPARSVVTQLPVPSPARKGGGLGASLAKPGVALVMRTAEGEENMTPFRSLDDLLSAVKPILRAAARSPDAVWFSIQPVDLASLDSDAA